MSINVPFEKAIYLPNDHTNVAILLLHAYTGSSKDMNLLGRRLHKAGYTVLCPNFKGHWTTDIFDILNESPLTWLDEAQAAYDWLTQQDFEKVFVFGLSMGGIMATALMTKSENNITGGGVFNSPVVTKEKIDVSEAFMTYARHVARASQQLSQFETNKKKIYDAHWKQMENLEAVKKTIRPKLEQINIPFYIAQSGQDELIDEDDVFELQDELLNAQIEFHWFPKNTHVITVNRDRVDFENSVMNFLEKYA